jgi:Protein kinase domain/ABC transporter, phosphonate, periplasmic substrate-binding protein
MSTESLLHNRYKLLSPLGHGGMCKVYLAEDTQNPENPECVVKTLKPAVPDATQRTTAKTLFQRGAKALEKLGDHPQIPRLLDFFEEEDAFYTVEEFIPGHSLAADLQPGERWSEAEVIKLLQELLPVLEFIHGHNVIHRDIKPDNILRRDSDNKPVLIDFGAVRQINVQQTTIGPGRYGTIVGTFGYMPTEQGHGNPRPNSDLYALGIVCIQALTGLMPAQLLQDNETGEVRWQSYVPVSPDLANILTKMVRYHFKDRYQAASEVLRSINTLERKRESMEPYQGGGSQTVLQPLLAAGALAGTAVGNGIGQIGQLFRKPSKGLRPVFLAGLGAMAVLGTFWGLRSVSSPPQFGGDRILTVGVLNLSRNPRQDYNNFTNYLRQQIQAKYGKDVQVKFDFIEPAAQGQEQAQGPSPGAVRARQALELKTWELAFTATSGVSVVAVDNNYQFAARMFPEMTETKSVLYVRQDSPIRSINDITPQTRVALGDFNSALGFFMPVYDLYGKSFNLSRGNRISRIQDMVLQGRVDVGAGNENRISKIPNLRIIHTSRDLPTSGVYLAPTLTSQERQGIAQILLAAPTVLQRQTHYGAGNPIDYTEYRRINQRVEEVTSCTTWPENNDPKPISLFCRPIAGVMSGYVAQDDVVNFSLQGEDGKTYRVVLPRSIMRQDASLSAPGAINFKRVTIANVQPVPVNGVPELRITEPGQMTVAAR